MKLYKRLFTVEDVRLNFGYDLMAIAKQGGFTTLEAACEAWCDEAALSIHKLVVGNRGVEFAKRLYAAVDLVDESNNYVNEELRNTLKVAQMHEMLFIVENGNVQLQAEKKANYKEHSDEALELLYSYGILRLGV
jgi:hypothetical protein